jgi:hypothetical protein
MIVDGLTLLVLVVLYFAYDRHALSDTRRDRSRRVPGSAVTSGGRVVPFRRHRAA